MNRVVITGLGIVSSIGNGTEAVLDALRTSRSGMVFMPEMQQLGYRCCVYAPVGELDVSGIRRKTLRTMSTCAIYATVATLEALRDAQLSVDDLDVERTGIVAGTCFAGTNEVPLAEEAIAEHGSASPIGALGVVKIMNSTVAAGLAAHLGVQGRVCSISAACATGLYNVGHAYELIKYGVEDVCICGSAEEDTWRQIGLSADNGDTMPIDFNDRPRRACRPYDRDRQGFVMSAGAGMFVLEDLDRARRRGAPIYGEIVGYGAANDGDDMFVSSGEGLEASIRAAMHEAARHDVTQIDYINTHGAGTPSGDRTEVEVLRRLFDTQQAAGGLCGPLISSTKGISGHAQGATASQEAVFTTLMLHHGFVAPTANLDHIAPECEGVRHVQAVEEHPLKTAMTINSGLGGVNACLIVRRANRDTTR